MLMEKIFEDEGTAPGVDAAHVNNNQACLGPTIGMP
jgi:hypothetical protein